MLSIRKEQFEVLRQYMKQRFEDRMVLHLSRVFPDQTKAKDETALRELIKKGVAKSATYGINTERVVCSFIDWMVEFSEDFDISKEYGWMRKTLDSKQLSGPSKVMSIRRQLEMRRSQAAR